MEKLSNETIYAIERLKKMGVLIYENETDDEFAKYQEAIQMAKQNNKAVAVNFEKGLVTVEPDTRAEKWAFDNMMRYIEKIKWDVPIHQQRKEEQYDYLHNPLLKSKIAKIYSGWNDDKLVYAALRLEKKRVIPFEGPLEGAYRNVYRYGYTRYLYELAVYQAQSKKCDVAWYIRSSELNGLFVISPNSNGSYEELEELIKNQQKRREDKPIEEQKKQVIREKEERKRKNPYYVQMER